MLQHRGSPSSSNCEHLALSTISDSSDILGRRYVNKDREITRKFVQHAEKRGIKGLFITVDAPQLGRREKVHLYADLDATVH